MPDNETVATEQQVDQSPDQPDHSSYRGITRILEYYGPPGWLEATIAQSRIGLYGKMELPSGAFIKSGVVMYSNPTEAEQQKRPTSTIALPPRPGGGRAN